MLIVDAQIHLWGKGTTLPPHRATPYLADEALRDMDAAGVDRARAASAELGPRLQRAVGRGRRAPIPTASPSSAASRSTSPRAAALIESWKQPPGHARPALHVPAAAPEELADRRHRGLAVAGGGEAPGLPVALLAAEFLPLVGQIAERHPGLKLIVDHLGRCATKRTTPRSPTCRSCWRWRSIPTSPSRPPAGPAMPPTPIPFRSLHKPYRAHLRCLRAAAHVLGHRHHAHALLVEGMRHAFHRA